MAKRDKGKQQALRASGTLNPRPEKVTDELFVTLDFFDPCDLAQVKYEMLRRGAVDGQSVADAARTFGLSRPTYYKAREGYESAGLAGGEQPRRRTTSSQPEGDATRRGDLAAVGERVPALVRQGVSRQHRPGAVGQCATGEVRGRLRRPRTLPEQAACGVD